MFLVAFVVLACVYLWELNGLEALMQRRRDTAPPNRRHMTKSGLPRPYKTKAPFEEKYAKPRDPPSAQRPRGRGGGDGDEGRRGTGTVRTGDGDEEHGDGDEDDDERGVLLDAGPRRGDGSAGDAAAVTNGGRREEGGRLRGDAPARGKRFRLEAHTSCTTLSHVRVCL